MLFLPIYAGIEYHLAAPLSQADLLLQRRIMDFPSNPQDGNQRAFGDYLDSRLFCQCDGHSFVIAVDIPGVKPIRHIFKQLEAVAGPGRQFALKILVIDAGYLTKRI